MIQRGRDQLTDTLPMAWRRGEWSQHHQLSGSKPSEVSVFVGREQLTSPVWWGFQWLQKAQGWSHVYPLRGNWGRLQGCPLFLERSFLASAPLPPLAGSGLNLPAGAQEGRGG